MHDGNTDRATEGAPDGATVHIPGSLDICGGNVRWIVVG